MDKKKIKSFAVTARNKLREDIKYQMNLIGITESEILKYHQKDSNSEIYDTSGINHKILYKKEINQRNTLIKDISEKGYNNIVEEVAYTWFKRIIAIRFMEINNYLPTKVRVLSSETENKLEPPIVTEAPNIDLNFDESEIARINSLKNENKLDDLFQFLFIKQCNELNNILPELFEKTEDYYQLLLSISFTKEDGIVRDLINSISEEDFKNQVEIIGWLYQYYNSELKEDTLAQLKKRVKITKERIPAATQLFTPDWIVKYMVENSLGRLWLENNENESLKERWKYYIDEKEQPLVEKQLDFSNDLNLELAKIKIIDPCMGSGHILVYVFDVLMEIYLSQGYNKKDAVISILKNNIYGLDIDDKAYQLAYFAIMMKARSYYGQIFKENINLNLLAIEESNWMSQDLIDYLSNNNPDLKIILEYIKEVFRDGKVFGSLINIKEFDFDYLEDIILESKTQSSLVESKTQFKVIESKAQSKVIESKTQSTAIDSNYSNKSKNKLLHLLKQMKILSQKYDVVVTNPPYMSGSGMEGKLLNYLKKHFPETKKDFFSAFMEKTFSLCKNEGHVGLLTPYVWMFIQSFLKLRENILKNKTITTLTQLEYNAFPEACVPVCVFTFKNEKTENKGEYIRLSDFKGVDIQETKTLEAINNPNSDYRFSTNQDEFLNIPGCPIAYWVDEKIINAFKRGKNLSTFTDVKQGLATGDNNKFLRHWYEVNYSQIGFNFNNNESFHLSGKKYAPYNKGGKYRKWYGNQEYVIKFDKKNFDILKTLGNNLPSRNFYFKESITWSFISSIYFGVRYSPIGSVFDVAGSSLFPSKDQIKYLTGLMCSKISTIIMSIFNPTLNFQVGDVKNIPVIFNDNYKKYVESLVNENINISKEEWDSFEESWNFKTHPLIKYSENEKLIENSFKKWKLITENNFSKMKANEMKINEMFIEIYNLNNIISPELKNKDITLRIADLERDVRSFLSYFVGCLFGRYSLDEEGLIHAGGEFNKLKYNNFIPNEDNIVPLLDTEYFEDDILSKFIEFLKITFSEETLQENIRFIANALGNKGNTYRETIRKYFINDFYKDHVKIYKKTPIYWMFNSGKENGFNALIYLHRYTPDTVAGIRTLYLHKAQKVLETSITNNEQRIKNSSNKNEKTQVNKENIKLKKQLEEIKKYDEALAYIAKEKIDLDLDDGVKVSYGKFQNVNIGNKEINLLKKI